eukprot:TRINITY_DN3829_c0_g1_i1.p1 TRINITY_DN3829_c0_g1~~TRINITY_DN3829_c0_g1_i1.p1  ORF type:complete len:500 (+),score=76.32 TRINITY_DN3829_c0_g1_i1:84-1502(+)
MSNPGLLPDGTLSADYQRRVATNQNRSLPPSYFPHPSLPDPFYAPQPLPHQPYCAPPPPYYGAPQPPSYVPAMAPPPPPQQPPRPPYGGVSPYQYAPPPQPQPQPQPQPTHQSYRPVQPTAGPPPPAYASRSYHPPQQASSSGAYAASRFYNPHAPSLSTFRPSGRKRALLVGINYVGTKDELRGCVRDVTFVHHLLKTKFRFHDRDFVVLTDVDSRIRNVRKGRPDRRTIMESLKWLINGSRPGDSLWFSFSGHGSQIVDTSGDESDGYDETLLPVDYKVAGPIVDDELYKIVRRVARGARLTVLLDACHSGTGLDLPYQHDVFGTGTGQKLSSGGRPMSITSGIANLTGHLLNGNPSGAIQAGLNLMKGKKKSKPPQGPDPNSGEVLLFAGCKDNQTAADTSKFAKGLTTGAMTYALIETIEHSTVGDWRNYNYRQLLQTMRQKLRQNKMLQTPQFSTSHPFDVSSPFVL